MTSDASSTLIAWQRSSFSSRAASAAPRSGRWLGRCPGCGAFGTLVEELHGRDSRRRPRRVRGDAERLGDVRVEEAARFSTGVPELDRVLGGGIVPASLVLLGGEPGVGKSTLLLTALGAIARSGRSALLVTGEESVAQVKLRAERLGGADDVDDPRRDGARGGVRDARARAPAVCVIDSVQTLYAARARIGAGLGRPGAGGGCAPAARREGERRRDDPRRPRDEGRRRSPARACSSTSSTACSSSRATGTTRTASCAR